MIRIDAIKYAVSQMGLSGCLLPGEPYLLNVPHALKGQPVVKRPTDQEIYALRSAILVGDVLPSLYGKLEVDFIRTTQPAASGPVPALHLTYIPEGIQDARVTTRVARNATLPDSVLTLARSTSHRSELARALWERNWPVRLIAQELGCSKTLIRRDVNRATLDHAVIARYLEQIPAAPLTFTTTPQGIHARDRDTEFNFRKAIGTEQLNEFKQRAEQYAAMCLDGSRARVETQVFAAQLWTDVDALLQDTGVSASRFAVELGYTTSGMRNAIARARHLTATNTGATP
ncbi:MAG: hypothetical protein WCE30_21870 [Mycobacterium sp.]